MAEEPGPYSPEDLDRALMWSAVLGWAGVTAMTLRGGTWFQIAAALPFAALIGFPIASVVVMLVGRPILRRLMRRRISWIRAASGGAFIAVCIAAVSIVIGRLNGYRVSQDPTFDFWTAFEDDGILTPLGWQRLATNTAAFIGFGALIGLVVRGVIGPGKSSD